MPADFDQLTISMRVPEGVSTTGELFFVTDTDIELDGVKYTQFDVEGSGEFTDIVIDVGSLPGWEGTIRSIRIDPVYGEPVAGEIDRIWFEQTS